MGPAGSLQAGKRRRSFPPSGLEREEEAGEVPPTRARGRAAGEREGGGERPAGNHLRLPRPPRPAPRPAATRRPSALCWGDRAVPELPGRRPRPQPSPGAPGPSPRPHPRPEWGAAGRRGGGGAGTTGPARIRLLTCAAAVAAESPSCYPGNAGRPVWVPLVSPLQGCQDFWDALVDLEEDLNLSPSSQSGIRLPRNMSTEKGKKNKNKTPKTSSECFNSFSRCFPSGFLSYPVRWADIVACFIPSLKCLS